LKPIIFGFSLYCESSMLRRHKGSTVRVSFCSCLHGVLTSMSAKVQQLTIVFSLTYVEHWHFFFLPMWSLDIYLFFTFVELQLSSIGKKVLSPHFFFSFSFVDLGHSMGDKGSIRFRVFFSCFDALPTPWRTQMWVQMKGSGRKSQDAFPSSQHFEGLRGVLELRDGTRKN
jgi:hypothetical protein